MRRRKARAGGRPGRDPVTQARIGRCFATWLQAAQGDERLSATEIVIYTFLVTRTHLGYGDGRVGVKRIAERVRRCDRTVRRCMGNLEAYGYVEIDERCERHGGPAVNVYRARRPRDWSRAEAERRRARRRARDVARKQPRARRGGTDTHDARPYTRGRVTVPSGTGDGSRQRPTVPVGQADRTEDQTMPLQVDAWLAHEDADGRWVSPVLLGEGPVMRLAEPRREREPAKLAPVRAGVRDPETATAEVADAQRRIAELVARGSRASGWRR